MNRALDPSPGHRAWRDIGRRAACMLILTAAVGAHAQDAWPSRPIRIVIPVAAGGGLDGSVRAIA